MEIGEKKGKDVIYDAQGNLIITDDEKILQKTDNVMCEVREITKSGFLKSRKLCMWRSGTLYETNKRLVFIRDPSSLIIYPPPPVGFMATPVPISKYDKDSDIKQYIQVHLSEIISWRIGFLKRIKIRIKDKFNNNYTMHIEGLSNFKGTTINDALWVP